MIILAAISVLAVAQAGPLLAAMGIDPAIASPINFVFLVFLAVQARREVTALRKGVAASRELARMAKGSESRAEAAAADVSRLTAEARVVLAEIVGVVRSPRDETKR